MSFLPLRRAISLGAFGLSVVRGALVDLEYRGVESTLRKFEGQKEGWGRRRGRGGVGPLAFACAFGGLQWPLRLPHSLLHQIRHVHTVLNID